MSGPHSLPVLRQIFRPRAADCNFRSHHLYYGHIVAPAAGASALILDEALVVYMQAPKSYTREDVVEIHGHGNFLALQAILELLLSFPVRLAEPGEFTKRAFLNGRIDLTQAEAVIDLLSARTRKGVEMAQAQLAGRLYEQVNAIRQVLARMRALIEVAIDFPDDVVEILDHAMMRQELETQVRLPLASLLQRSRQGRMLREGVSVVIAGRPNVGKSSLLNALLQSERALVTALPGTTRDTIEEYLDIEGLPVRLVDTAGIRENAEEVEGLGIRRARQQIEQADLILLVIDLAAGVRAEDLDIFGDIRHKPVILVGNKVDLLPSGPPPLTERFPQVLAQVFVSARREMGVDELKQAVFKEVAGNQSQWEEAGCTPNLRHQNALARAYSASDLVRDGLQSAISADLLAIDLQECLAELDIIVGATTTEDILDLIFQQFCLGK